MVQLESVLFVTIAQNSAYLTNVEVNKARELLSELSKMSMGYKKYLESKIKAKTH